MNVRAHLSMLFHLDKCIGCHTCSVACKNIWTDREGAEYMWWNNVETKPGTGYPTRWEDQEEYRGGWERQGGRLRLRGGSRLGALANLFFNPRLPELDDYYEPFTFKYRDLFEAPLGEVQPAARPVSTITGEPIEIEAGPNWDDSLGGSNVYAGNDPNLEGLDPAVRAALSDIDRVVYGFLPRICNHCLNPSCIAACPSGAIYKRAEDGVVLVNEERCKGWRMCVSACPYKKVYYNWNSGKSEKCILCFPRVETGQAPACAHSCVGRIRYFGVLLYDADRIVEAALVGDRDLVEAQREVILDPFAPTVIAAARASGIDEGWLDAARRSPAYRFVKEWKLALPLHPEYRTGAMMYYIPPLSPVMTALQGGVHDQVEGQDEDDLFHRIEESRLPLAYLANLFAAGNTDVVALALRRMMAVRIYRRAVSVEGEVTARAKDALAAAGLTAEQADQIFHLTSKPTFAERFALPPYQRELAIEALNDPLTARAETGFGVHPPPRRGP